MKLQAFVGKPIKSIQQLQQKSVKGNLTPGLDVWILGCGLQPPRAVHQVGWSIHKSTPWPSTTKHDKGQPACRLWFDQTLCGFSLAVLVPLLLNKIAANLTQELPKDVKLNGGYWQWLLLLLPWQWYKLDKWTVIQMDSWTVIGNRSCGFLTQCLSPNFQTCTLPLSFLPFHNLWWFVDKHVHWTTNQFLQQCSTSLISETGGRP